MLILRFMIKTLFTLCYIILLEILFVEYHFSYEFRLFPDACMFPFGMFNIM